VIGVRIRVRVVFAAAYRLVSPDRLIAADAADTLIIYSRRLMVVA